MTTFAVRINLDLALELPPDQIAALRRAEGRRAAELANAGILLRLWRVPDESWGNLGLWEAVSLIALDGYLRSLPLYPWMRISVTRLGEHPSDPALRSSHRQDG